MNIAKLFQARILQVVHDNNQSIIIKSCNDKVCACQCHAGILVYSHHDVLFYYRAFDITAIIMNVN